MQLFMAQGCQNHLVIGPLHPKYWIKYLEMCTANTLLV